MRELQRHKTRFEKYGITADQFHAMCAAQGGVCALCRRPPSKQFHVDHCHETGRVRGLLCHLCNTRLVVAVEQCGVEAVGRALAYLGTGYCVKPAAPNPSVISKPDGTDVAMLGPQD